MRKNKYSYIKNNLISKDISIIWMTKNTLFINILEILNVENTMVKYKKENKNIYQRKHI